MTATNASGHPRVAVVTGGGRGIGAAIAEHLAADGAFVVTIDPLVALDGSAAATTDPEPTTADRIVAAGGQARASSASVTDRSSLDSVFGGLVDEFGGIDAVVNVAGISRPSGFASGEEADWHGVVSVHLDGYRNVLAAALPHMAAAGRGTIVGVTSGSGWRAADAGAYSCAKRAVAALTWQLGRHAPPGVTVNALSPIAHTRMVTAALARSAGQAPPRTGAATPSGALALASGMPAPEEIGPIGAYLAGPAFAWCSGQIVFGGGSEVALIEPPRLIEVIRTDTSAPLAGLLDIVLTAALIPAEARQASGGGSNPRFGAAFADGSAAPVAPGGRCGVVVHDPALAGAVVAALTARGARCEILDPTPLPTDMAAAAAAVRSLHDRLGGLDAVVVGRAGLPAAGTGEPWDRIVAEHDGLAGAIVADAAWARAVADHAAGTGRAVRLVSLVPATTSGGRSRAQAAAQLSRVAQGTTEQRVSACAVAVEGGDDATVGEVTALLAVHPEAPALSGAELAVGPGWFGLRAHPHPTTSVVYGGPELPPWLDPTLRASITGTAPGSEEA